MTIQDACCLRPWHTCIELHCMYQHCNILGCNAAHSCKYYRRFDRMSVNVCKMTRSHVPEHGSLRSQLRISFVFLKRSIKVTWNPEVQQEESIVKWLSRHLYTATTHILCHLDPGRVFRTAFFKTHFIIISLSLVFPLHLFLPRLCMRYLSFPHVLCASLFIPFFAIILLASCEDRSMVKSRLSLKTKPWRRM